MKLGLAIEKKNRGNIGQVKGHNIRLHATKSQLPKSAWITPQGHHSVAPFNDDLIEKAKGLAKRKDAVLAVELVFTIGNQTDWREMPTAEHPYGKRKPGASAKLNAIMAGVKEAAHQEFGKDRIISIDLHTDESTPHVHVVFAPIKDGKLQAKAWLNGVASCGALRERLHGHVNKFFECTYEKGAPGGAPHDPSKAAGAVNGPKPELTFLEKASDLLSKNSEIKALKGMISELNQQIQTLFSKLKGAEKRAADEVELREKAEKKAQEMRDLAAKQRTEIKALEGKIKELTPEPPKDVKKGPVGPSAGFLDALRSPDNIRDHQKPK